jgi:hypothetical protein
MTESGSTKTEMESVPEIRMRKQIAGFRRAQEGRADRTIRKTVQRKNRK